MLDPASPRARLALGVAAVLVAVTGAVIAMRERDRPAPSPIQPEGVEASKPALISDESERAAYVEKSVQVTGLDVAPETQPDGDGGIVEIGGVLKVAGQVENRGDRALSTARLSLQVLDAQGQVIGAYFEDIVGRKRLEPGESRPFKFTIPRKKEYGGKFNYQLR